MGEQEWIKKNKASGFMSKLEDSFNRLSKEAAKLVTDLRNDPTAVIEKTNEAIRDCKSTIKKAYDLIDGK